VRRLLARAWLANVGSYKADRGVRGTPGVGQRREFQTPSQKSPLMLKSTLVLVTSFVVLSLAVVGGSFAQSGSRPSGTPTQETADTKKPAAAVAPKVVAITFYADWCPGCKELKPKLEAVMATAGEQPALFVKLDQTDKKSRQSEFLLASLGLGELWKEHAGRTGYTLLVDSKTKKVVATFQASQTIESMKAALQAAVKA